MSDPPCKKTPAQMVADILSKGPYDWHAPIPRLVPIAYTELHKIDWQKEYAELLAHHSLETDVLLSVIREMRRRLKNIEKLRDRVGRAIGLLDAEHPGAVVYAEPILKALRGE